MAAMNGNANVSVGSDGEKATTTLDCGGNDRHEETVTPAAPADDIFYGIETVPSPPLLLLFGFQQTIMTIGSVLSLPFIISGMICAGDQPDVTAKLLSITLFMCGISTVIQCIFGVRLGIVQGGSHTFVSPILAMMALQVWACPDITDGTDSDEIWKSRMREISGNLMIASLTQLILGLTGVVGLVLKYIGPLTIAPTISLIGLSLTKVVVGFSKTHWGLAFMAGGLIVIFSLFMGKWKVPIPAWSKHGGCHIEGFPIFQLFPVILSIGITWLFSYILTATDVLPAYTNSTNLARTDARLDVVERAPWFYWPYPFQFGRPTFSAAGYVGMLAASISSIIESIGDYYAAARISGAPPPPPHAINRGIAMEGLGCVISGMVGSGHGTTSYSSNIGAIGITKVASRSVYVTAGVMLILCGVIGKFGAVLSIIPDPIIGGTLMVLFSIIAAVGLTVLKFIDLDSTRNITVLGLSLLLGLMIPEYINDPENVHVINTGNLELDQVIKVLLGTAMFVGGVIGLILDNIVPGTEEERGVLKWREMASAALGHKDNVSKMYDLPVVTKYIEKVKCCSYVPFSPTFDKEIDLDCTVCCSCRRRRQPKRYESPQAYDNPTVKQNDISDSEIQVAQF